MAAIKGVPVRIGPTSTLAFKPSKGLTAVGATAVIPKKVTGVAAYNPPKRSTPVGTRPKPPPVDPYAALSQQQLDTRASALANAGLSPQEAEVRRQQANARAAAVADEGALTGLSTAAAGYLAGIPAQVGAGYQDAAATVGAAGTAVGGQVGADLAAKQAADQQFAESQGQSGGSTFSGSGVGDTVSYLGGVVPAEDLAHEGAAAQAEAAKAVQIPLDAGRDQLTARMAQAHQENDQYAQQLIGLAAQFPGLKAQALQQLNQYEIDKATYRENIAKDKSDTKRNAAADKETKRVDKANIVHARTSDATANRALDAQIEAAGLKSKADIVAATAEYKYKWAGLSLRASEDRARLQAESRKGKTIDTSASKLMGHVVYKDGTEDPSIKVKQTTASSPQIKAQYNRAKDTSKARVKGYDYATKLRGKPVAVDKKLAGASIGDKKIGMYVADPKAAAKGYTFPPAYPGGPPTTNKVNLAQHTGGATDYADAATKVWAEIDGDGLMARYGYSQQQVMAIVNAALRRAGWRK